MGDMSNKKAAEHSGLMISGLFYTSSIQCLTELRAFPLDYQWLSQAL